MHTSFGSTSPSTALARPWSVGQISICDGLYWILITIVPLSMSRLNRSVMYKDEAENYKWKINSTNIKDIR